MQNLPSFQITGLPLSRTYIPDYADSRSSAFRALAQVIESKILSLFQSSAETSNSGILGVNVTALRNGSVLADMNVLSREILLSASSVESVINGGIANGSLVSIGVTVQSSVTVQGK